MIRSEKDLERAIIKRLNEFDDTLVFKSSYTFSKNRKVYGHYQFPFAPKGVADILGIFRSKPIAIEVKWGKGQISEAQSEFLTAFKSKGGIALVIRSLDELEQCLLKTYYKE